MSYVVKSSEKLRPSAAETETKALLYLMNFRDDSDEIYYFVVDFFNDLTGMSRMSDKMWDVQSKGAKKPSPYMVGTELVTLYKNYVSDFEFDKYVVFLGGATSSLRKDDTLYKFDINNIKDTALIKIKEGLLNECKEKTYIADEDIEDGTIDDFLKQVYFVIDNQGKSEYVKKIIKLNSAIIPDEATLVAIFNEIRDAQSGKKNIKAIEGITLEAPDEALNYGRHISSVEIRLLVLNRILNRQVVSSELPPSFAEIYTTFPEERRNNLLEDCQLELSKALFDVNGQENFWRLFENIYNTIIQNPTDNVNAIYRKLDNSIVKVCMNFETLSLKYFVSKIKDGIEI